MQILKRIQYNSPVILTFTILSSAALLISLITDGNSNFLLFSVYKSSFTDPLAYIRIFTHVLGHIDLNHFLNNFILILLIGPIVEEKYGSVNLALMMLLASFVMGAAHILLSDKILLGASGIAFFLIIIASFVNFEKGKIPLTLILVIIIFVGKDIYEMFTIEDNVSRFTHIIGAVSGLICGYILNTKPSGKEDTAD